MPTVKRSANIFSAMSTFFRFLCANCTRQCSKIISEPLADGEEVEEEEAVVEEKEEAVAAAAAAVGVVEVDFISSLSLLLVGKVSVIRSSTGCFKTSAETSSSIEES